MTAVVAVAKVLCVRTVPIDQTMSQFLCTNEWISTEEGLWCGQDAHPGAEAATELMTSKFKMMAKAGQ